METFHTSTMGEISCAPARACSTGGHKSLNILGIAGDLNYDNCRNCSLCSKHIQHGDARKDFELGQAVYYDQSQTDPFAVPLSIMRKRMARGAAVMLRYLTPNRTVLEISPGGGQFDEWFQGKPYRYLGCEISARFASRLTRKKIPLVQGDFEIVKFFEVYDLVLSFHTIEHTTHPCAQIRRAFL